MIGKKWKMGLQKWIVRCMIGLMIGISGCSVSGSGSVQDAEDVDHLFQYLKSYEAQTSITFYSNKGENTYEVHQKVMSEGQYRLEILEPEAFSGVVTVCDGEHIWQTDPTIGAKVEAKETPVRTALLLFSFIEAYQSNQGICEEGENDTLILTATYPGEHHKIVSARLNLAKESGAPLSLEIFDERGETSIHITYSTFVINPELSQTDFTESTLKRRVQCTIKEKSISEFELT